MNRFSLALILSVLGSTTVGAQAGEETNRTLSNYIQLYQVDQQSITQRLELKSDIDPGWDRWQERGYSFGFDPQLTPMYTTVDGILSTPYMIQVRGNSMEKNKKRWGYHVFEGFASDDKSRITMLVNKHIELEKPVAELYYYGTVYNHSPEAYNWFKIGSDVRQHSFMFGRDQAIFYGSLKLTNALTVGNIGYDDLLKEKPEGDDETNFEADAKHVNYVELKKSGDGTLFYDKDLHMLVIKVNGAWMKVNVTSLPEGVEYDF
jgi:hypothetical protein